MTVIDPYTVNLHVLFLFFSLKTFPAAAMSLRHFLVKKKKKKRNHIVCAHISCLCSSWSLQNFMLSRACFMLLLLLFFTVNAFASLMFNLLHHQIFSHAGWTVWEYTLHSRCCEHGTTAKVRLRDTHTHKKKSSVRSIFLKAVKAKKCVNLLSLSLNNAGF